MAVRFSVCRKYSRSAKHGTIRVIEYYPGYAGKRCDCGKEILMKSRQKKSLMSRDPGKHPCISSDPADHFGVYHLFVHTICKCDPDQPVQVQGHWSAERFCRI